MRKLLWLLLVSLLLIIPAQATELRNTDFMLEVAKGNVTKHTVMLKFGRNPDVDSAAREDVWDGGGDYTCYPDGAGIHMDIVAGVGDTQTIRIFYLDGSGAKQETTATLNAGTEVDVTPDIWRVYRMVNEGTTDLANDIFLRADNGGTEEGVANNVLCAQISIDPDDSEPFNQTLMAVMTCPASTTCYMTQYGASFDRSGANLASITVDMELLVRQQDTIGNPEVFAIKSHHGIIGRGSSHIQHKFRPYLKINALSDIKMRTKSSQNDADVHAGFDIIEVAD